MRLSHRLPEATRAQSLQQARGPDEARARASRRGRAPLTRAPRAQVRDQFRANRDVADPQALEGLMKVPRRAKEEGEAHTLALIPSALRARAPPPPRVAQAAHGRLGFLRMVTPKARREVRAAAGRARAPTGRAGGAARDAARARRDKPAGRTRCTAATAARSAGPAAGARAPRVPLSLPPPSDASFPLTPASPRFAPDGGSPQPQGQRRLELGRFEPRSRLGLEAPAPRESAPTRRRAAARASDRPVSRAQHASPRALGTARTARLPEQRAREGPARNSRAWPCLEVIVRV